MDSKAAFHFAKLSLFNSRLLGALESARRDSAPIEEFVAARIRENAIRPPLSLIHQGTFIGHAYVALVWLRESLWKNFSEPEKATVRKEFEERFNCETDVTSAFSRNPKKLNLKNPIHVWRLMRNAIAHARVDVADDGLWTFRNDDPERPDGEAGSVVLTMEQLGRMCDAALFAYQSVLYPSEG